MDGKGFVAVFCVLVLVQFFSQGVTSSDFEGEGNGDYVAHAVRHSNSKQRSKRQVLVGGGNVCTQTFLVPQTAVSCDVSPQVQEEMTSFRDDLQGQVTQLDELKVKVENMDPDKPRPLPEEVRERLETIIRVRESQAGLREALDHVDATMNLINTRIDKIEEADRLEVARLIEQQTNLIKVTLHQSNMTLHEEYVDRLTESTRHLTDKLRELQDELNNKLTTSETRLDDAVKNAEVKGQKFLDDTKRELLDRAARLEEKLTQEGEVRQQYQVQTMGNQGELEKLSDLLTTLREHQALYEQEKEKLKAVIAQLQDQLIDEKTAKEQLSTNIILLNSTLERVTDQYTQMKEEIKACHNKSSALIEDLQSLRQTVSDNAHLLPRLLKVSNCQDARQFFHPASGVYSIKPGLGGEPFDVFCDMEDGQGWTVLQHRDTGKTDFYRGWNSYKEGFGDLDDEHWLGLEKIHTLTKSKQYQLRVDLQDWNNKWWTAEYDTFSIEGEMDGYTLHVSGYHGDAGDALRYHNGMGFSTHDRNHDKNDGICARWCHGAWWYRDCFHSNLNGKFYNVGAYKSKTGWGDGIVWRTLKNTNFYSVKAATMKIKPYEQGGQ